ncbi:MAG: pyridoxamine 5'-phosphate oxidase family protein [Syntrophorhabdales bacterium]|jgi:hypothetical protein
MPKSLMEYVNKSPRVGTLSTASREGLVDAAYFGSARMIDEETMILVCGNSRTLANLQQNPHAVFAVIEPGPTPPEWKGVRVYLTMTECQTEGDKLDAFKKQVAKRAGDAAAQRLKAAVTFKVAEVRPFNDAGQGWEQSI